MKRNHLVLLVSSRKAQCTIKVLACSVPGESPLLVCRWPPSRCVLTWQRARGRRQALLSLLIRKPISSRGPHPHARGASPTFHKQMPSRLGFGFQHISWGGGGGTQTSRRQQPPSTKLIKPETWGQPWQPPSCSRLHTWSIIEPCSSLYAPGHHPAVGHWNEHSTATAPNHTVTGRSAQSPERSNVQA